MNWHRGLFWGWAAVTLVWWAYCFPESQFGCRMLAVTDWQKARCEYTDDRTALIAAVLWPAVWFVLGWSTLWVIRRVRIPRL